MKLGFICLNMPGHLNPMIALARHLQHRNHDARANGLSAAADLIEESLGVTATAAKV
jgi:UDP:flavonoid glycosyltransferase YjiC (YdhE family)